MRTKAIETLIYKSWWVFIVLALCYMLYSHSMKKKNKAYLALEKQLLELQREKQKILEEKEDLLLQIDSQNDPAWIQMMLMKELGVVPEGQLKVYFKEEEK